MAERTFYVVCKDDCLTEGMSKEQILTAIEQSLEQGYVSNPDSAVFSKIKEIRANGTAQIWIGTEAQFNAISPAPTIGKSVVRIGENDVMYICSDDSTLNDLSNHLNDKNNPHGVTFKQVAGADVLPISKGGTDASNAADARSKLGLTPKNIGALPASGGDMTGGINFGKATRGLGWTTADGTQFALRPYAEGNLFQITRTPPGGTEVNAFSIDKDGNILFGAFQQPLPVESGGTGNTNGRAVTAASADTATKLATARTIQTNLGSTSGVSFDGSANVAPGVTGVLPVENGGTGASDASSACTNIGALPASGGKMTGFAVVDNGNYAGMRWYCADGSKFDLRAIGNSNTFQVTVTSSSGVEFGAFNIDTAGNISLANALPVSSGGTGAATPETARANIGAFSSNGGALGGSIDFGATANGLNWKTADGTEWNVRPWPDTNLFQIVRHATDGNWYGDFTIDSDGNVSLSKALPVTSGGTGASNSADALRNLGIQYSASQPAVVNGGIWLKPVE